MAYLQYDSFILALENRPVPWKLANANWFNFHISGNLSVLVVLSILLIFLQQIMIFKIILKFTISKIYNKKTSTTPQDNHCNIHGYDPGEM